MAEYYEISKTEMEDFLFNEMSFPSGHNPLNVQGPTELVYGKGFRLGIHPVTLRVYSSIQRGTARSVGNDSIKVCLILRRPDGEIRGIGKTKRVHRVKGWRTNLKKRITDMVDSIKDIVLCPKCEMPMSKRNGKTEFWGCTDYPQCKGTRSLIVSVVP